MIAGLIQHGIDGAKTILKSTEDLYQQILDEKGEQALVGFPDTAYYLPLAYGFLGEKAACVSDLSRILATAKTLREGKTPRDVDHPESLIRLRALLELWT